MSHSTATARKNMVDCQIQTNGVSHEKILGAFARVPREMFLPAEVQPVAYNDEDIILPPHGYVLSPMTHARLLQVLGPRPDDVVLNIGDTTGYASAILSALVMTVVTLDKGRIPEAARKLWGELSCDNIVTLEGENTMGCPQHAPYTAIILNGAVSEISPELLAQLSPGGRLVCILRRPDQRVGTITMIECDEKGCYSHKSQFDSVAPWVKGFAPRVEFRF